ncbi:MAG: hypothetical protein ACXABD_13620, partial [Candidatus Thorarchaeota archaeon]
QQMVHLTLTEQEFETIRSSLCETATSWLLRATDNNWPHREGARLIQRERESLKSRFDDAYKNTFIHKP